jgi:magnesium transporter
MASSPSDVATRDKEQGAGELASAAPELAADTGPAAATDTGPAADAGVVKLAVLERGILRQFEGEAALAELPGAFGRRGARMWIDVCDGGCELKTEVAGLLKLHPLLIEDLAERDQRAKLEPVDEVLHAVIFSLGFDAGEIYERELDFVLGDRFLLTAHSRWWNPFTTRHVRIGAAELLAKGPGHLLWCLADDVIDSYFPILDQLGDEIDELEDKVVGRADRALLERLFDLKRQLIQVRRVTSPEREIFNVLSNREDELISAEDRLYFRDAYDHLIRLTDELDTYRELASATLEAYLSTVNNNLSLIMKRLTGVTVVVAGLGAIAGIFGMSEAQFAMRGDEGPGFWIVVVGSLIVAAIATAVLRLVDWI